ncbi:hypothetical protein BHE74_00041438, partial [Ensete ventricosum]
LPLKSYYRFVVPSLDDFSNVDYSVNGPKAFFSNMPLSKTLTMNLDVPEPWLVEPVVAMYVACRHDLDNILLENLGDLRTLQAVFELEALLLTGLALILGTKRGSHLVDTLVMANLGYWQMKVSPGVWYLQLAPGRSADLYALKDSGDGSPGNRSTKLITINDLRGRLVHLEVAKKRGKEHEELLNASDDQLLEKRKLHQQCCEFSSQNHKKTGRQGETINIFSIASGHLYERFLKIMILSVLKNTQRPVKFWFIKNYLSPQFKDLPNYAQHTVPIFSLPQEWLWCESWCGNATKAKAKTIDLCNNPMTKEPKLQGARRIVPEWVDLDAEARQLTARILGEEVDSNEPVTSTSPLPDGPQNNHKKDEL